MCGATRVTLLVILCGVLLAARCVCAETLNDRLDRMQDTLDLLEVEAAQRALEREVNRATDGAQQHSHEHPILLDPKWRPAPGAQPFYLPSTTAH